MDETYNQIWSLEIGASINDLAVSADGRFIGIGADNGLHVVNSQGALLWSNESYPVYSVSISRDGETIAADAGSKVRLFDRQGEILWEWKSNPIARGIVLAEMNSALIASRDAIHCFPFFGEQPRWSYSWGDVSGICATPDGRLVIAGTEDGEILLLDESGGLIDLFYPSGDICSLAVDAQGESFVALDYKKGRMLLYGREGELRWEKAPGEKGLNQIATVSMSGDGSLIACDLRREALLWDREGEELARYGMDESVRLTAINAEGTVIVIGGENGRVEFQTSDPALSAKAESLLWESVSRIRSIYVADPAGGFCAWLDAFDRALPREQFDFCEGLLDEIGHGYSLSAFERAYVESRRGALWLGRGIALHRIGEHERARECYRQGLRSHTETNNLEGEGQARLLLDLLPESGAPEDVPRGFTAQLKALGSAEAFLTHQVEKGLPPEQLAAILTAGRSGYLEPLLAALSRSDAMANNAAAALGSLNPGPNREILLRAMTHPGWFVRWRAVSMLRQRDQETTLPGLLSAVVQALPNEPDPAVLRNLIRVIEKSEERDCVTAVMPLVQDSDADVRHAVCRVLARIGDRRAIQPLELTPQGFAFFDNGWVREAADEAMEEILARYPSPEVGRVLLFRRFEDGSDAPLPTQVFPRTASTIHGLVALANDWRNVRAELHRDPIYAHRIVLHLAGDDPEESDESVFFFDDDDGNPLVELLPEDDVEKAGDREVSFSIPPPPDGWQAGIYGLEVYLNGEPETSHLFEIVETTPIERVAVAMTSDEMLDLADRETDVIPAGWNDLSCLVTMNGFAGLRIEGRIFDEAGGLIVEAATRFTEGGEHLQLRWPRVNLRPGVYTAVATSETGTSGECRFRVVESARVLDTHLARPSGSPEPFNVVPPPLSQRLRGPARQALMRQAGGLINSDAGKSVLQWWLVGLLLKAADWLAWKLAGGEAVSSTLPLHLAHRIAAWPFYYWWIAGGLYWAWKAGRVANHRLVRGASLTLTWIVFSLFAQEIVYIVFGLGHLWPDALGGLFRETLFARPFYAWGSVILLALAAIGFDKKVTDEYKPLCFNLLLMIPLVYGLGLLTGAAWGMIAWGALALFSKSWAQAAWGFVVKFGFAMATIGAMGGGLQRASRN